jgi:hypothetical protein
MLLPYRTPLGCQKVARGKQSAAPGQRHKKIPLPLPARFIADAITFGQITPSLLSAERSVAFNPRMRDGTARLCHAALR